MLTFTEHIEFLQDMPSIIRICSERRDKCF